jgi:hypothetical protein
MFWPVGYLLVLVGLLGALKNRNYVIAALSLLLVVSLQYYDTGLLRKRIHAVAIRPAITHSEWEKLVQSINRVNFTLVEVVADPLSPWPSFKKLQQNTADLLTQPTSLGRRKIVWLRKLFFTRL